MAPSTTAGSSNFVPPSSPNHRRAHDESSVPLRRSPRRAARRAPWDAVPDDTLARALSFVDARCLVEGACLCCRRLRDLLCDEGSAPGRALFDAACERLWADKAFVAERFRAARARGDARAALLGSLADARRTTISRDELCALTWSFRFKEAAGAAWTDDDPWHAGGRASRVRFRPSGAVEWLDDRFGGTAVEEVARTWRFRRAGAIGAGEACSATIRERGDCVQVGHYPRERAARHAANWGWILHSVWVVYTSFDMPSARATATRRWSGTLGEHALARRLASWQWAEVHAYNAEHGSDSDSEED